MSRKKRGIDFNSYFLKSFNPTIKFLIISDVAIVGAGGLIAPVFALFVEDFIQGGNAAVAGMAAAIFLFTKSILQIPVAHFIDKIRGERDDFWILFIFSILMALVPLLYLIVSTPTELFIVQFFYGLFTAMTFPSYMAIFTKHIDKRKEGTEWGVYFTLTDIVSALLAGLGGYMAATYGFHYLIISVSILMILGAVLLYPIKKEILVHPKN